MVFRPFGIRHLGAALVLALPLVASAALPEPVHVTFPSLDTDREGKPLAIPALLFRPAVPAPGAEIPLVVAVHGCGGMYGSAPGRADKLSEARAAWTELLLSDGYAVLLPDSFTPRGFREICTIKIAERAIKVGARRLDELGALAFGAALRGIDRNRIALIGWSHGGSTTLATINVKDPRVAAFIAADGAPPFYRVAVAMYPGCQAALHAGPRWEPGVPTAIHIGAADDWAPAQPCVDLGRAARARKEPLTVTVYPDSHHGFDAPRGKLVVRKDVPNGVNPGQGVTAGPNPVARAAALDAVRTFLRERLRAQDS